MEDEIDKVNRETKQGKIVITDEKILDNKRNQSKDIDAKTSPTMSTLFSTMTKKFQQQKGSEE